MTTKTSITPDQAKQFKRFVEDACDRALREVDPDRDGLQRLIARGGEFQDDVIAGVRRFTAKAPDYEFAKAILGKDFISPEEIAKARGLTYTDEQLVKFHETLPTREVLEWCRASGCMLVAGPPRAMSLLDIRAQKADYFASKEGGWYAERVQKFARGDKVHPIWIALRKEPVADSLGKNWDDQSQLVEAPMLVPNVAEVVWGLTTYKAVRGVYLLPSLYVRTSSLVSNGNRVYVGGFGGGGLGVDDDWVDRCNGSLGVSSARKFD